MFGGTSHSHGRIDTRMVKKLKPPVSKEIT